MPDYTFHTLSPIDFENLVRDLIQSELSIRLESFKAGKDLGIDFRYSKCNTPPLIIQVKHYVDTGFRGLLSHLRTKEKPKIDRLQPVRYLLATSVPLSPTNKDELRDALFPHVKGTEDIYGREDLNNLLSLFPEIERQNIKLWLSSTAVLEEVLHSRILSQTRITLQEIKDKASLYVANASFNHALKVLNDYNYVIIAGIPGIGKTTLAKMLVLNYLRSNYDFIDVSYDISEAYSIPAKKRPRIFLYDDFLGRTSIEEKLRKNEDHRLLDFITSVRKTKSAKLILTTREYILHQAQETYEILNSPVFDMPQCIVDLSKYTRPIKAQILYNHLYFSQLKRSFIEEIVRQAAYLNIIDHPNYNPRIIEYMTDPMWISSNDSKEYPAIFLRNLQKPFLIWEQAFNNHLTPIARETLIVLGTLPREVLVEDLERATKEYLPNVEVSFTVREFQRALSELQGNFIVLRRDRGNDIVAFHNPSIHDFIESYIENNPTLFAPLLQTVRFFEQTHWICEKVAKKGQVLEFQHDLSAALQDTLSVVPCRLINYSTGRGRPTYKARESIRHGARLSYIATLLLKNEFVFLKDFFQTALREMTNEMVSLRLSNDDMFELVKNVAELEGMESIKEDFFAAAKVSLFNNAYWVSDVSYITDLMELHPQMFVPEDRDLLIEKVKDIVYYLPDDDDPQYLSDELSNLEELDSKYGFGLYEQIDQVRDLLTRAEENQPPDDEYDDWYHEDSITRSISDDALDDMFSTLIR